MGGVGVGDVAPDRLSRPIPLDASLRAGDDEDAVVDRESAVVAGRLAGQARLTQTPAGELLSVEEGRKPRRVGQRGARKERRDVPDEGQRLGRPAPMVQAHQDAPGKGRTPPDPSL